MCLTRGRWCSRRTARLCDTVAGGHHPACMHRGTGGGTSCVLLAQSRREATRVSSRRASYSLRDPLLPGLVFGPREGALGVAGWRCSKAGGHSLWLSESRPHPLRTPASPCKLGLDDAVVVEANALGGGIRTSNGLSTQYHRTSRTQKLHLSTTSTRCVNPPPRRNDLAVPLPRSRQTIFLV